ncbi:MAG: hypothetical protein FRX48_08093 [Lasallia pustulata]|uniref:Uncharacterized protein n=1 Tax=Lasallia pustulata TaxID=136370 RepID=A0A5M8PG91_9LECA|nr:MAG: hypothetical protein FRX48_08093 [Lasallia pustulata]
MHRARRNRRHLIPDADGARQLVDDLLVDERGVHVEDGELEAGARERGVQLEDGFEAPGGFEGADEGGAAEGGGEREGAPRRSARLRGGWSGMRGRGSRGG